MFIEKSKKRNGARGECVVPVLEFGNLGSDNVEGLGVRHVRGGGSRPSARRSHPRLGDSAGT